MDYAFKHARDNERRERDHAGGGDDHKEAIGNLQDLPGCPL
jgi:hypothetical protein